MSDLAAHLTPLGAEAPRLRLSPSQQFDVLSLAILRLLDGAISISWSALPLPVSAAAHIFGVKKLFRQPTSSRYEGVAGAAVQLPPQPRE